MKKVEHIGIAVKDLDAADALYEKLLGVSSYKTENVESEGVKTAFFKIGTTKIELLQATNETSAIAKFIAKKGEGMHHIAFAVADINVEILRLEKEGFTVINKTPKRGADNKLVAFLHPKNTYGVLIELCQDLP